jgi:tetratricopeptide (TPR) repeat protein
MCSTCRRSYYCSENCQKHDWPSHKLKCVSYEERLSKLEKPPLALATKDDVCVDCKRPAKAPLFLPCGHVVCLGCMISSDQINDRNACPECKSIYVTSEGYFGLFPHGLLPHLHLMKQFTETETSAARILNDPHVIDKEAHYDALEAVDQAIASSKSLAVFIENDLQRGVFEAWKIPLRRLHQMCRILQGHFLYLNGKPQDCIDASLKALSEVDEYLKDHYRALPEARAILERLEKDGIEALYDAMSALSGNAGNSPNMLNLLVLRAYFVLGKAHEALQKPTDALEWYSRIPSKAQPNESQCAAEGLMARSQLKLQLGNTVASLKLAKEALLVDNSVPGVHKNLAGQLQDAGDLMAAKKTMNQALYYEAPWDKANKMVNKSFIAGIYEEERRIEERRIREVRFLEIWGELIDAAWTSKQTGQFISWETGKFSSSVVRRMSCDP